MGNGFQPQTQTQNQVPTQQQAQTQEKKGYNAHNGAMYISKDGSYVTVKIDVGGQKYYGHFQRSKEDYQSDYYLSAGRLYMDADNSHYKNNDPHPTSEHFNKVQQERFPQHNTAQMHPDNIPF